MATLYIEPFSGLAGDMFLAALLDLGDERFTVAHVEELARALVPGECTLALSTAWRQNLSGKMLDVRTSESANPPHRHLSDLLALLERAPLSKASRERAANVFRRIAVAEGRVHGCSPEEIHFHEVGAVDTLIDVAGAMLALEKLGVERVVAHAPVTGTGTVRCAHGEMPVPAPAVAELLRGREMNVSGGGGERLTPTGAALLAELVERFEAPSNFIATKIGYGAGHKDPKEGPPNLVRVQLGELAPRARSGPADGRTTSATSDAAAVGGSRAVSTGSARVASSTSSAGAHPSVELARDASAPARAEAWLVEVNLDDMTGEELAHAARKLRDAGALDVWSTSVQMKKDRPGIVLSALCRIEARAALESALFEHTTTLGVRWSRVERMECGRRVLEVDVGGHAIRVKVRERPQYEGSSPLGERDLSPEHDDLARAAAQLGVSLRELERRAIDAALHALDTAR